MLICALPHLRGDVDGVVKYERPSFNALPNSPW